jgi:hypothetical protein
LWKILTKRKALVLKAGGCWAFKSNSENSGPIIV